MKYYKLKNLCLDIVDCPHSTPEWKNEGIRVIRNFNLKNGNLDFSDGYFVDEETYEERVKRAIPEAGDIIISREAPMGVVAIVPENLKCCLGQRLVLLKVDRQKIDPVYLVFILMSEFVQTQFRRADATGSIVSNLCIPDLEDIIIPVVEEGQEDIARLLEIVNKKILLNKSINENLQKQLELTYNYWFNQFNFPNKNGMPYKNAGGKMIHDVRMNIDIPEGWHTCPLLDVVAWESNSQPPKSEFVYEYKEGYIRFIQNRDYDSSNYKTYIPYNKKLSTVTRYDILMDKYGDAGAVRYGIEGAFNVALGKINVKNLKYQEYVRSYLESSGIYSYLHNSCMASTRASLNESNLSMLNIVIPDEEVVDMFQKIARNIRESILKNKDENEKLAHLREWILPMLMNGQAKIEQSHN